MSGKNPRVNPLALRKQMLVAESELNRSHLIQDWQMVKCEVHSLVNQARTVSSIASAVANLVAGLSSLRQKKSATAAEKPSWWQTLLKGAGVVSTLWQTFRAPTSGPNAP